MKPSEEITDNDIKLLKKHFDTKLMFIGHELHKLIDEHKKTPVSILKMIIETPKEKMAYSRSILIPILVITFTVAIGYKSLNIDPVIDFILAILVVVMLFWVCYISIWFIGVIEIHDQKLFVLKLMIALKKDDEEIKKDVRLFLQSKNEPKED